jgi:RecA/RadA recombinase
MDEIANYIPFGRITEVYGPEGSCKTAFAMRCCVRAQLRHIFERKVDPETDVVSLVPIDPKREVVILFIDNEQSLDDGERLKVDGTEIDAVITRCDTIADIFKMVDDTLKLLEDTTEDPDNAPLAIVVVDTVAGTSTDTEMNAEWGSQDYPRAPKQLRQAFSKVTRRISRHNMLLLCTNQVGANYNAKPKRNKSPFAVDLPRPDDFISPGGKALKFYARLRIFMFPVNLDYKIRKSRGGPDGILAGFVTVKNCQAFPRREGRLVLLFDRGLSNTFSRVETMIKYKSIVRGERGILEVRLNAHRVTPTTFPELRAGTNPRLSSIVEWPAFYEAHRADLDLLWKHTIDIAFNSPDAVEAEADEETDLVD